MLPLFIIMLDHISPSRGIRWDPDFVEPSLDGSALSESSPTAEPPLQLNLETDVGVFQYKRTVV